MQQIISPKIVKNHRMTGIHRNHHANNNSNSKKSNDDNHRIGTLTSSTGLEYLEALVFHDIYFRDLLLTSDSNKKSNNDNRRIGTVTTHMCSYAHV